VLGETSEIVRQALEAIDSGARASDLESELLEFKADRSDPKKTLRILAEVSICLANAQGGAILLGVDDSCEGPDAYSGTEMEVGQIRRSVFEATTPHLTVGVSELAHLGKRIVAVQVPVGAAVHALVSGRVLKRVGRDCLPLDPAEVAVLDDERRNLDRSATPSVCTVADIDSTAMGLARRDLEHLPDSRSKLAGLSDLDLCRAIGVADAGGRLTAAGELMFCQGASEVIVYQHRPVPGGPPDAAERLTPPLIVAYHRAVDLITVRQRQELIYLGSGQQAALDDFPERAVREALANAVAHQRLSPLDPVHIEHSDVLLTVTSPGALVGGVTVENILTTPSRPRNRVLVKAFRDLGLIEELGTGVPLMYREMLRVGKSPPSITAGKDDVRVSLLAVPVDLSFARFALALPASEGGDTDELLILFHLCRNRVARVSEIAGLLQRGRNETEAVLHRLAEPPISLVEPTRSTLRQRDPNFRLQAHAVERLGSSASGWRWMSEDIESRVAEYVSEFGQITNQVVRNLLGVSASRASAVLRDLVDRKVLVKTSESRRGPGVEYGPGSEFPEKNR